MVTARRVICALALALPAMGSLVLVDPSPAVAAPAAYQVGMKLRAKQSCTVQGYAIKEGVVLTVAAVQTDEFMSTGLIV